jgi:hypothetical protein
VEVDDCVVFVGGGCAVIGGRTVEDEFYGSFWSEVEMGGERGARGVGE